MQTPMPVSESMPGTAALLDALDGGAELAHAVLIATMTQVSVFGRKRFHAHTRELAAVAREQELAEFRSAFEASI